MRPADLIAFRREIQIGQDTPAATDVAAVAPEGVLRRLARRALAMRRTPMGRLLYRVTPEPVIDALKARLHG